MCNQNCNQGRNCSCGEDLPQRGTGVILVVAMSVAAVCIVGMMYILNRC